MYTWSCTSIYIYVFQKHGKHKDRLPKVEREQLIKRLNKAQIGEKIKAGFTKAESEILQSVISCYRFLCSFCFFIFFFVLFIFFFLFFCFFFFYSQFLLFLQMNWKIFVLLVMGTKFPSQWNSFYGLDQIPDAVLLTGNKVATCSSRNPCCCGWAELSYSCGCM